MPSRLATTAIILFWLTMTGWLIEREVLPLMLAEDSPSYQVSLTDEIGSPLANWTVFKDGERIGSATSNVTVHNDRTCEFRTNMHLDRFNLAGVFNITQLESMYRVTQDGKLQVASTKASFILGKRKLKFVPEETVEIVGEVDKAELFQSRMLYNDKPFLDLGAVDISKQGNIVNPMHLVSRLRGLRKGQTWRITMFDPLRGILEKVVAKQAAAPPTLIAEVKTDHFEWDNKNVACYKIEYAEPGKAVSARTWVRKVDGLVLQQEASYGFEVMLTRVAN